MTEYIVNLDGELGMALAVACAGAGFAREEIVRCGDCKHYKPWVLSRPENGGDCYLNKNEVDVTYDGFCKWGERKEGSNG